MRPYESRLNMEGMLFCALQRRFLRLLICLLYQAKIRCTGSLQSTLRTGPSTDRVKMLRSDRGGEFTGGEFTTFLVDSGICHQLTSPHTLKQNGSAERENHTLVECVRTMLHTKRLSLSLWGEAVQTAAYLVNRTASRTRVNRTPHELWIGQIPAVAHLRVFGCVAYAHIPKVNRRKLDPKSVKAIFVGYCTDTKAYRLWNAERRKLLVSRDVIFDEFSIPGHTMPEVFSGLFSFQEIPLDVRANPAGTASLAQFTDCYNSTPTFLAGASPMHNMQLPTASTHSTPLQRPQVSPPRLNLDTVAPALSS